MSDRTGRPEQVSAPAMRGILNLIDRAIENGSLDPQDRDEVIQMFLSNPKLVLDNKAEGGLMSIFNMTRPLGYKNGGETGFLTEPPPGMEFKPMKTMEYRDFNQNGKEDRSEGLYLPKDFQPITKKEGLKKIFTMPGGFKGTLTDEQKKRIAKLLG